MRKLMCIILALCVSPVIALADVDLSSMTYDELLALRDQLNSEIISRPEWFEVRVPAGEWIIGKDIPEGYYSITAPKLSIVSSNKQGSARDIFYHVLSDGEVVGKEFFQDGCVFKTSKEIIISPPFSLGF